MAGCIPTKAHLVPIQSVLIICGSLFFKISKTFVENPCRKGRMTVPASPSGCIKFGLEISNQLQLVFYQPVGCFQLPKKKCCQIVRIPIFSSSIAPHGAEASNFALSAKAQKQTNN
jgi:hypothetical protein